jgi:ABC-2 type transport system ATP-binding protein
MRVLEIENVTKHYRKKAALAGVSIELDEGYVMGIVGPNGAGKTTLLKAILNLVRIDSGRISLFGTRHTDAERATRDRIGFVHEESYLYEPINLGDLERICRAAYTQWNRQSFRNYVDRFELPPKRRIKEYSKGMKMRLSVAVALSHEAELIVMDEPSSGLDPLVRRELIDVIGEELARENRTFLIATHITSDLDRIADYVVVLDGGQVRLSVTRDEMADNYALCKGGTEVLARDTNGCFRGVSRNEFGFTALTSERQEVAKRFGDEVVMERATIEDLMVHTLARTGESPRRDGLQIVARDTGTPEGAPDGDGGVQ